LDGRVTRDGLHYCSEGAENLSREPSRYHFTIGEDRNARLVVVCGWVEAGMFLRDTE
jgi:hypothetical protein